MQHGCADLRAGENTVTSVTSAVTACPSICCGSRFAANLLQNGLEKPGSPRVTALSYGDGCYQRLNCANVASRSSGISRVVQMDKADLTDDEVISRVDEWLRREHPDVLDSDLRLRRDVVARLVRGVGGERLNRDQVDEVIRLGRSAAARQARKRLNFGAPT